MHGGFRQLIHPASRLSEIDLAASRADRQRQRGQVRLRQRVIDLLAEALFGEGMVEIRRCDVLDGVQADSDDHDEPA